MHSEQLFGLISQLLLSLLLIVRIILLTHRLFRINMYIHVFVNVITGDFVKHGGLFYPALFNKKRI